MGRRAGPPCLFLLAWLGVVGCSGGSADDAPADGAARDVTEADVRLRCQDAACDDGDPCTRDACTAAGACGHEALPPGAACDDGDACTTGERCDEGGRCAGGAPVELSPDACLQCRCDPLAGVTCTARPAGAACDDGDCCTDSDRCTACVAGATGCTDEGIRCAGRSRDCDDENPCTDDGCDCDGDAAACRHRAVSDGSPCEADPNACTAQDTCQGGVCTLGAPLPLDDGNPCTRDSCEKEVVVHTPQAGQCDDGDPCTEDDRCAAGVCVGGQRVVCQKPPCASSVACRPDVGCVPVWTPAGTVCDDGDACSLGEVCDEAHECVAAAVVPVDDGNPCTRDVCDPSSGTVSHPPQEGPCDDGDPCSVDDVCRDGVCTAGAPDPACEGCSSDAECEQLYGDGDWCNGVQRCDRTVAPRRCALDPESVVVCPPDAGCTHHACAPADGLCRPEDRPDGAGCEDPALPCGVGRCAGGVCVAAVTGDASCDAVDDDCDGATDEDCPTGRYRLRAVAAAGAGFVADAACDLFGTLALPVFVGTARNDRYELRSFAPAVEEALP